jgi:hypothetical protein
VVDVFEADPPTFVVPDDVPSPRLGIAATAGTFTALAAHPDVLFNGDMSSPGWSERGFPNPVQRVFDVDAGAVVARTSFVTTSRTAADFKAESSRGVGPQGAPDIVHDELYSRYWMRLSDNFGSTVDAIKIPAMGVQWGWWNISGYWQQTTGNGGSPPTGLKVWNSAQGKWEYQGSSIRILVGMRATDNSAYSNLMSLGLYPYNLDQAGPFPPGEAFPYVALRRGRAYWFDIRVKQNSVSGTPDVNGNYPTANHDGVYQVWINGYQAFSKTTFRWRRNLEHGVQGIWIDWFHGGTQNPPYPMEFSTGPVTLAKQYIGPPR